MNQLIRQEIYVMRLWHERSHSQSGNDAWRVTITDTRSQEKYHFANLETLFRFFKEKLEDSGDAWLEQIS
jgi:hypothetical protein